MIAVLGVLKTQEGLRVKEEMLEWMRPVFDVLTVEQESPGALYEYPAIALACDVCHKTGKPVLYIHTKGAGNPHAFQSIVRRMWRGVFGNRERLDTYVGLVDTDEPRMACPVMGDDSQTWFNAFVMNPAAAAVLRDTVRPSVDRYFFECVARGTAVKVVSPGEPVDATGAVQFVARYNF